jgi:hypothetical protein
MVLSPCLPAGKCAYDPEQDSAIDIEAKLNASRAASLTQFGRGAYPVKRPAPAEAENDCKYWRARP